MALNLRFPAIRDALLQRTRWVRLYIGSLRTYDLEGYAELTDKAMEAFEWLCDYVQNNQGPHIPPMFWQMRAGTVAVTQTGNVCIMLPTHKNKKIAAVAIMDNLGEQFALYPAENLWYLVMEGEEPFTIGPS